MDNEKMSLLQEWTDKYNEAEKKIQEIEKQALGVRENFKYIYREEMMEQQKIQIEYWNKINELMLNDKKEA